MYAFIFPIYTWTPSLHCLFMCVTRLFRMCGIWRDSFMCVRFFSHIVHMNTSCYTRTSQHRHDSYVPWLMCDMTHTWRNSYVTWLICDMTHMWHDSYVTWLMCDMTHVWHDSYDMTHVSWMSSPIRKSSLIFVSHFSYEWVISHMSESFLIFVSHFSYEWVISHMSESWDTTRKPCHIQGGEDPEDALSL